MAPRPPGTQLTRRRVNAGSRLGRDASTKVQSRVVIFEALSKRIKRPF